MSARKTFTWTTWARSEPACSSITRNVSRIRVAWVATSLPTSWPVAGSKAAVPPMVMNEPTLAMWLYGPIGAGVPGGVAVSTLGMPPSVRRKRDQRRSASVLAQQRLVQRVPAVGRGHARFDLGDDAAAGVAVGHHDHAVALADVGNHRTAEAPVRPTVAE